MGHRVHVSSVLAFGLLVLSASSQSWGASEHAQSTRSAPETAQSAAAGPRRSFCVSCYQPNLRIGIDGFARFELGYPVADWFPVDLQDGGRWKLAILLSGTPTRVGLFDPLIACWVDGPRDLPVTGRDWGVGDWDSDGYLEYAYLSKQSIWHFDTRTELDTLLWSADYVPSKAFVWGTDSSGSPLIGLLHRTDHPLERQWHTFAWDYYQIFSGRHIGAVPGGMDGPLVLNGVPGIQGSVLAIYELRAVIFYGPGPGSSSGYFDGRLRVVTGHWTVERVMELPHYSYGVNEDITRSFWGMENAALIQPSDVSRSTLVWIVRSMQNWGLALPSYLGGDLVAGAGQWLAPLPYAYPTAPTPSPYAAVAGLDTDDDGLEEVVMPLRCGAGWEVRDPQSGRVIDTIAKMPAVGLVNGALLHPEQRDLFYLADSGLYIWWGRPSTAVAGEEFADSLAPVMTLVASPNPFNSTVHLGWSPSPGAATLEVLNILGQRIRSYDLSAANGSPASVEWDGRDNGGNTVSSGIYFARLSGLRSPLVTKLVLLK